MKGIALWHGLTLIGGIALRLWASLNPRCKLLRLRKGASLLCFHLHIHQWRLMSYMGDCISPECRPLRRRLCQQSSKAAITRDVSLSRARIAEKMERFCFSCATLDLRKTGAACKGLSPAMCRECTPVNLCSCVWVILRWSPGVSVKCVAEAK